MRDSPETVINWGSSKVTQVCVVGLGHWGPNLVRAIEQHPDARVVVAADSSADRRQLVAEKIPNLAIESSFSECLEKYDFDSVVIAVPTEFHFQIGMQALEAGKNVLMEKPLALNSQEASELCDEATRRSLILMTGHVFLYNDGITACKEIVDRGELGNLYYIHSLRTNLGPVRMISPFLTTSLTRCRCRSPARAITSLGERLKISRKVRLYTRGTVLLRFS